MKKKTKCSLGEIKNLLGNKTLRLVDIWLIDGSGRYRKDMGDIEALANSIRDIGLLQPIVLVKSTDRFQLIAGARRLAAVSSLDWMSIPAYVIQDDRLSDVVALLKAERDENTCRKDFTPSEAVAIGKAIEDLEKPKAKQRQAEKLKKGNAAPVVENCHDGEDKGKTRDKVAEAVGMSGRTYEKAKRVVDAAEKEPEKFQAVKDEMDRTGKVDGAYKKVRTARLTNPDDRAAREKKVLDLYAEGKSFKAIGKQLGVTATFVSGVVHRAEVAEREKQREESRKPLLHQYLDEVTARIEVEVEQLSEVTIEAPL